MVSRNIGLTSGLKNFPSALPDISAAPGAPMSLIQMVTAQQADTQLALSNQISSAVSNSPRIDDWPCRPSSDFPRPVILVHGTFENAQSNWVVAAPVLAA